MDFNIKSGQWPDGTPHGEILEHWEADDKRYPDLCNCTCSCVRTESACIAACPKPSSPALTGRI